MCRTVAPCHVVAKRDIMADTIKFGHSEITVQVIEQVRDVHVTVCDERITIKLVANSPVEVLKLTNALLRAYAQVMY